MIKTFHKYVFQFFRHQKLFVIFMAVILVVGGVYINDTRNSYIKQAHHHAIMLAQSAEAFISTELVSKLNAHSSDVDKSEYQQLKDSLIRLKQRDQHILYAYLYA